MSETKTFHGKTAWLLLVCVCVACLKLITAFKKAFRQLNVNMNQLFETVGNFYFSGFLVSMVKSLKVREQMLNSLNVKVSSPVLAAELAPLC